MKTNHASIPAIKAGFRIIATAAWLTVAIGISRGQGPVAPGELVAPRIEITGGNVKFTVQPSVNGRKYQLQASESPATGTWQILGDVVTGNGNNLVITTPHLPGTPRRFYRLALDAASTAPEGFVLIPAGSFLMGDQSSNPRLGGSAELPVHSVQVSAFYMAKHEVTKELWDTVRVWGTANGRGYTDLAVGNGSSASKGANHPVHSINWYDMVKWCNARSQKEGLMPCYTVSGATYKTGNSNPVCNWGANGYRLPTEAEWEKAARGGVAGKNFPWGTDTITHSQANYKSNSTPGSFDVSPTPGFHPTYATGGYPYTSPVGSFAPNGYGLYDMAGNMWEWCWDWGFESYYTYSGDTDPRGPYSGSYRTLRGGSWGTSRSLDQRCADRTFAWPGGAADIKGLRLARSSVP